MNETCEFNIMAHLIQPNTIKTFAGFNVILFKRKLKKIEKKNMTT